MLYQPSNDVLTGVPVYFWSETNPIFRVVTTILGVGVNVLMNPSFVWNFGDGSTMATTSAGGPYPNSTVTHIYKGAGTYTVSLEISWAGTWAAQGAVLPVLGGAIVQSASAIIEVNPGPTDFTR
ncbi:MAG: PKD domain-containing protein [Actinomycetota bacterium]